MTINVSSLVLYKVKSSYQKQSSGNFDIGLVILYYFSSDKMSSNRISKQRRQPVENRSDSKILIYQNIFCEYSKVFQNVKKGL